MNRLILILILTFSFQNLTKADDIRDFQIEGISVGDSLLEHISKKEILENIINYPYTSDKYYVTSIRSLKYLKFYEFIEIYLKKNDKKYIIYSIDAAQFYNDKAKCLKKMDDITKDISGIFATQIKDNKEKLINHGDPSGKSIYYRTDWEVNNNDLVAVECYFWSQGMKDKYNYSDHIRISATRVEIDDWLRYEAFN